MSFLAGLCFCNGSREWLSCLLLLAIINMLLLDSFERGVFCNLLHRSGIAGPNTMQSAQESIHVGKAS